MRYSLFDGQRDIIILIARVLLMILFVLSGWAKLTGFDGTVGYMTSLGAPAPMLAAAIAVIMEFVVAILLIWASTPVRWRFCSRCSCWAPRCWATRSGTWSTPNAAPT